MTSRFQYSRWDGTQTGFEFDADAAFDELTDELLYHGDVNAALRKMMQDGMRDRDGNQLQGLRELLEQLREERQNRLDQHDLGGVYDEINDELNDLIDEERHAIENALRDAHFPYGDYRPRPPREADLARTGKPADFCQEPLPVECRPCRRPPNLILCWRCSTGSVT